MTSRKLCAVLTVAVLCAPVFGLFGGGKTDAAAQNLAIGPAIVQKSVADGGTANDSLSITNGGSDGYPFSIYATPYGVQNQQYKPVFTTLPGFANITSWFHFSATSGYLNPYSSLKLDYSVHVPAGVAPGSYYAAVFAQTKGTLLTPSKSAVKLNERVGSLFYITVPGQAAQKGSVAWNAAFLQQSPAKASLVLKNDGKLYYISTIRVYYSDMLGDTKYEFSAQKIVLSHTVRSLPVPWPHSPAFGLFKVSGSATVYGQQKLETKYILIMSKPVRILAAVILGFIMLMGLIGIINMLRRRHWRH